MSVSASAEVSFRDLIIPKDGSGAKYNALVGYNTTEGQWQFLKTKKLLDGTFVLDLGTVTVETNPGGGMTINQVITTVWDTAPPTKCYEFIISLPSLGSSSTLFTIGTLIAQYRAFVDDIIIIRDEAQPLDYMSIQLIDMGNNKTIAGGEIVPACPNKMTPATPLVASNLQLLLQNKSEEIQRIKISIIVSVRKVTDPIYSQPY